MSHVFQVVPSRSVAARPATLVAPSNGRSRIDTQNDKLILTK